MSDSGARMNSPAYIKTAIKVITSQSTAANQLERLIKRDVIAQDSGKLDPAQQNARNKQAKK